MDIKNALDLQEAIKKLEDKSMVQKNDLIDQFHATYESFKPINLLKSSLNKVVHSPGTVDNVINATIGLGAGVISKRLLIGKSAGILKKLFGMAFEFGVAGLVSKNSDSIKSGGINLLSKIFKSKKSSPVRNIGIVKN